MAIVSALLSLILRQLGTLIRAILGWSVTALFGRLPATKQTALAAVLLVSLVWPVLVVGIFFPSVAAWGFAFVPLQKWWGVVPVRILSITLSTIIPPIVGLVTRWLTPSANIRGGVWRAALVGYPITVGYALSCLLTAVIVPLVKVASALRRWEDEHAFVQPRDGHYMLALEELQHACRDAGVAVRPQEVPIQLSVSTKLLKWLARGALDPIVAEDPKVLKGADVELYLYPADLLLRGEKKLVARVRACITRTMLERHAYLTSDESAQQVEDEIRRMWEVLERHDEPDDIRDIGRQRLAAIARDIDTTCLPFDDWFILDRSLQRLELEMGGGTRIPLPVSDTRANDDLRRHEAERPRLH